MNKFIITEAVPGDAHEITKLRRETWLTTYPNEKAGITEEDIEEAIIKRTAEDRDNQVN